MVRMNFDARQYDTDSSGGDFEPIPEGWYKAEIIKDELKNNKAGTGQFINFQFKIIGERYGNRRLFHVINIKHPNPTVVDIGKQELARLAKAVGVEFFDDTAALHGKPVVIRVEITKPRFSADRKTLVYKAGNKIAAFKPLKSANTGINTNSQGYPKPRSESSDVSHISDSIGDVIPNSPYDDDIPF